MDYLTMSRIPVNSIPRNEDCLTMNRVPINSIPGKR
jgi:hypothetical protein